MCEGWLLEAVRFWELRVALEDSRLEGVWGDSEKERARGASIYFGRK